MGAYFDNNATTPLDPRVRDAMVAVLGEGHGNPSSVHRWGRAARQAVEPARGHVAALIGARSSEIIFTASGTESNNTVIFATGQSTGFRGHLVITALEHPSVRAAAGRLAARGMEVTEVPPDANGMVQPDAIAEALRPDTHLVCLMLANNELGTLQPVKRVAQLCHERGIAVLTDAVQAVGKIPVSAHDLGVDFLTLGGHKCHGPLGAAALWIREGLQIEPLLAGGGQEGGMRSSTENVPAIVGLGKAAELAAAELAERRSRLLEIRGRFERGLQTIPDAVVHCTKALRLPHTTHVAFPGLSGHELVLRLDAAGYSVSTGAACEAGRPQASRVLLAMGISEEEALASIRVSFGFLNSVDEVPPFIETLATEVSALRKGVAA